MTRRSSGSAFAPDAFVFPGGVIDATDCEASVRDRTIGLDPRAVAAQFERVSTSPELPCDVPPVDSDARQSLLIATLRELFEEAGILIGATADGTPLEAADVFSTALQSERKQLADASLTFARFLERHHWFADVRALTLFSHWITPPSEPRRYDTHFFFAAAPPLQAGVADAVETHDGVWIAPQRALQRHRAGTFHLVYPTIKHLERLTAFTSLAAVEGFARSKPIVTVLPATTTRGRFTMPSSLTDAW